MRLPHPPRFSATGVTEFMAFEEKTPPAVEKLATRLSENPDVFPHLPGIFLASLCLRGTKRGRFFVLDALAALSPAFRAFLQPFASRVLHAACHFLRHEGVDPEPFVRHWRELMSIPFADASTVAYTLKQLPERSAVKDLAQGPKRKRAVYREHAEPLVCAASGEVLKKLWDDDVQMWRYDDAVEVDGVGVCHRYAL